MSDAPIRIGHPDLPRPDGLCGCCEGTRLSTVQPIRNRPDLSAIAYRVGDHARFKASMLAALASSEFPALARLGTRDDDDFSIALIDAWATACDVLTFYQERHANEAYIQTALERLSVGEIARLIGYRLHPGSAAETDLVFLMEDPPGAPPDVAELTIPAGTRVQSQPGPDETPQVFETVEPLAARVAWNQMRPRQNRRIALQSVATGTWLEGQATGLRRGDAVLVVHPQRGEPGTADFDVESDLWAFLRLTKVEPDADLDRTWIEWEGTLGEVSPPGETDPVHRFYALRQQASLFGYNAPHPLVLTGDARDDFGFTGATPPSNSPSTITGTSTNPGDWDFQASVSDELIPLDAVYKEFVADGWAVLTRPGGSPELYRIVDASTDAAAKFAVSGRATRITLDRTGWVAAFTAHYRRVAVFGASEELALAETPQHEHVSGAEIELDGTVEDLPQDRLLYLTGRRAQVLVDIPTLPVLQEDGTVRGHRRGTRLTLMLPPFMSTAVPDLGLWLFADEDGVLCLALALRQFLKPVAATEASETLVESALLDRVEAADPHHSKLVLTAALTAAYDRASLVIHGNVAPASHGEKAVEILGGGDPSRPFQSFVLKQNPVTQLVAATENGIASTLRLRVDQVEWQEVPSLYGRGPTERVFATALTDAGETVIRFGDSRSGARPPAGRDNIQAEYRKGLGRAGNVRAGQLSLPLDRPLGLKSVMNPRPAGGGDDAEQAKDARRNAPIYTLTLGRVVSITDYRDFALGYPGIAKADARWVWDGWTRRIVVTVAGADGATVPEDGPTYPALLQALRDFGDPFVKYDLISYDPAFFRLALKVVVDPAHDPDVVLPAVEAALRAGFAFAARDFAQPVALGRVAAIAHGVPGVVAVDVDRLYREDPPQTDQEPHALLVANAGRLGAGGDVLPAEILTLSPEPLDWLEELTP